MKYMRELAIRVYAREKPASILAGLNEREQGHMGEGLLRFLILHGIHPTDPAAHVIPYTTDPDTRRLINKSSLTDRLDIIQNGLINSGGADKIDVTWRETDGRIAVCSSKIGCKGILSIDKLEVVEMLVQFSESGGYTENGQQVLRSSIKPYVLVRDRKMVEDKAKKARSSNQVTKDNLNNILDLSDLTRMCAVLNERVHGCKKDIESILSHLLSDEKHALRTRLHQKLIKNKAAQRIKAGAKTILIGALPRSGKTYIAAELAKKEDRILVATTRPSETAAQWNSVFKIHREFSAHKVVNITAKTASAIAKINITGAKLVAIVSMQFLKGDETNDAHLCLGGLEWDLVIIDEVHEGGTTELSSETFRKYTGVNACHLMMTATYTKPVLSFAIPSSDCMYWDLEDVRLMRQWGEPHIFKRLCEKYGEAEMIQAREETYKSGETDASIRDCYTSAPQLKIFTNLMQTNIYNELREATNTSDNVYGFSMRSLFMPTKNGNAFQNQQAVDRFLELFSGSKYMQDYKKGNMSMLARIQRYFKIINHRERSDFITMLMFVPYGQGQKVENVKPALIARLKANKKFAEFATMTFDSGSNSSKCNLSEEVARAVVDAKAQGKTGLIILTGNVGSLGVSLPEVDVAVMLHDIESADMNYQQMLRVLTEMVNKKCGIVVDFNVWRTLTTLNTYATSRCGQNDKSSAERINWCVSNLVDIDPDLWECPESPVTFSRENILDELTRQWRKMLEQTGSSLNRLPSKYVDLGEDQKELDRIAKNLAGGNVVEKKSLTVNPEQEKLAKGIDYKKESDDESEPEELAEELAEEVSKQANINDVLARLIPEISILSKCEYDLRKALSFICDNQNQCEALNNFLAQLYKHTSSINSICVIRDIVQKHYIKLNDALEIYEYITSKIHMLIDNPQELIAFLGQHLKPKELEKKKYGEVFTPPELIHQKLDKLTLVDPRIWSDPTKKFLDPANGIGNYPAIAFHRLMEGLKQAIPNDADRKKHILENMLYMCELNKKNVEVSRNLFDPHDEYDLNIWQGSYLDLDITDVWGVEKFDVILGNPPFQDDTGNKGRGHHLWVQFVSKSLLLLKPNGFLVFVHPAGWRQPGHELLETLKNKQFHYLSIHDEAEGVKTFHSNTRYDWYILENCQNMNETTIECQDKSIVKVDLTKMPFIPNSDFATICALTNSSIKCVVIHSESAYECRKKWISKTQTDEFTHPVVYSVNRQNVAKYRYSSRNDRGHFGIPKIIFGSGATGFINDTEGTYGLTQWAKAVAEEPCNLETLKQVLDSTEFLKIIRACSVSKAEINVKILKFFNKDFWRHFENSTQTTRQNNKTPAKAEPVKAPAKAAPAKAAPAKAAPAKAAQAKAEPAKAAPASPYTKKKVTELKELCKEKKIKGITGKSKAELIAMLESE